MDASSLFLEPGSIAGTLFQEAGDALLLIDPISERLVDANPKACQLSEFSREELLHFSIRQLLKHEQDWQDWLQPVQQTLTFHGKDGFLLRSRQPGRWIPVSITISRLHPPGGSALALFTLRDRSEQIEAYRRLQRTEAELRRVLVSVSDCLWSCRIDKDGRWRFRYLSPVIQKLTGRSVGVFLEDPQAREQSVDPRDLPAYRDFLERLTAGYSGELEYRLRRPDQSTVWVRESVTTAPDEGGLLLHGVMTDISERKRSENETQRALQAERYRLDSLTSLAGRLAQEFSHHITSILGHVELARLGLPPDSLLQTPLQQIEAVALRAADWTGTLAYLTSNRLTTPLECDLTRVLYQLQNLYPEVRFAALPRSMRLHCSEVGLSEMLRQLLQNAVESTTPAPMVRVNFPERGFAPGQSLELNYAQTPLTWLEVEDEGPGMSIETLQRLFEPLFTTREGHRGVGLARVLTLVRLFKGSIQVRSQLGQGTQVRLGLPALPPETAPNLSSDQVESPRQPLVLLAEDEEAVRDVIARLLRSLGCSVLAARHGEEALSLFAAHREQIRLALIDLNMPRLDGEPTIRQLRAAQPQLPIILMSGYGESDHRSRLTDLQLAGYLQKPFRLPMLMELLKNIGLIG